MVYILSNHRVRKMYDAILQITLSHASSNNYSDKKQNCNTVKVRQYIRTTTTIRRFISSFTCIYIHCISFKDRSVMLRYKNKQHEKSDGYFDRSVRFNK